MNYDGQGIDVQESGVPLVEAVYAPAGADSSAIFALSVPSQSTTMSLPVQLGYSAPPDVNTDFDRGDGIGTCKNANSFGAQLLIGIIVAVVVAKIVR